MNDPLAAMGSTDSIRPKKPEEHLAEGGDVNLTCSYEGSIYNIQWYRQNQNSRPEFLLYITETGSIYPEDSGFGAHIDATAKTVDLQISSAAASDSAVYYCALQPTVTGNTKALYKNLWSKDHIQQGATHSTASGWLVETKTNPSLTHEEHLEQNFHFQTCSRNTGHSNSPADPFWV